MIFDWLFKGTKTKLDPNKITYDGSSLSLVIKDPQALDDAMKKEQDLIEPILTQTNLRNKTMRKK